MLRSTMQTGVLSLSMLAFSVAGCGDDSGKGPGGGNSDAGLDASRNDGGADGGRDSGTDGGRDGALSTTASVRVAHLAVAGDGLPVRACIYTAASTTGLGPVPPVSSDPLVYKDVSDYIDGVVSTGVAYTLKVFKSSAITTLCPTSSEETDLVAKLEIPDNMLVGGSSYTLAAFATATPSVQGFLDDRSPSATKAKVRALHAAVSGAAAGPTVKVCFDADGAGATAPVELAASLAFKSASDYVEVDAITTSAVAFAVAADSACTGDVTRIGETTVPVAVPAGSVVTAFVVGDTTQASGATAPSVIFKFDHSPST